MVKNKRKWFCVVCALIGNDCANTLTTVMTNIVVRKSADNAEPLSFVKFTLLYLTVYSLPNASIPCHVLPAHILP